MNEQCRRRELQLLLAQMFGSLIFTEHTVCKLLEFREHRHETYVSQLRREGKLHQIKRSVYCVPSSWGRSLLASESPNEKSECKPRATIVVVVRSMMFC